MKTTTTLLLLLSAAVAPVPASAQDDARATDAAAPAAEEPAPRVAADAPIDDYRIELLQLAYDVASALPLEVHAKNRARAQERVVEACLELDQPVRALRYAEGIENWRRGAGYADYAYWCAKNDCKADAERSLQRAADSLEEFDAPDQQAWRLDRIRSKIARAYAVLGDAHRMAQFGANVQGSEMGRISVERARQIPAESIDATIEELKSALAKGDFDMARASLEMFAVFYARCYGDEERREAIEAAMKSSWTKMPVALQVETLVAMTDAALEHGDAKTAARLLDDGREIVRRGHWIPEDRVRVVAVLAACRYRTGDVERARSEVNEALITFDGHREEIVDIYRAEALVPIAEAQRAMGDLDAARRTYARALDEAVVNPNSRPRVDDLVEACVSMAVHAVEPDDAVRERLREVRAALGDPW